MKKLLGRRNSILPLLYLLLSSPCFAQFNLEDNKGLTSIGYSSNYDQGVVLFNSKDKKIKFNYIHYINNDDNLHDIIIGLNAEGKIKNDISNIFTSNNITSESVLGASFGIRIYNSTEDQDWEKFFDLPADKRKVEKPKSMIWLFAKGNFLGSEFKLFSEDSTFESQIFKESFSGYNIDFGINYFSANFLSTNTSLIAGFSIGPLRTNNLAGLTERKFIDRSLVYNSDSTIIREIQRDQSAWNGDYRVSTKYQMNIDVLVIPAKFNRAGILAYYRMIDSAVNNDANVDLGMGLYFFREETNFTPLAGINLGWNNVAGTNNQKSSFAVTIVTAFNIFVQQ